MSTSRFGVRTLAVAAAAGIVVLAAPGIASAHVTAQPSEFAKGGRATWAFRVPNERPDAGTVKIEVTFPAEYPLASVRTKPLPGWKTEIVRGKLDKPIKNHGTDVTEAVKTVTWTADPGVRIEPDQYQEFFVSGGPLPENTDTLVLPTKQTYDNNEVVDWSAPPPAEDAAEPEHPAPALKLTGKAPANDSRGAAPATDDHAASADGQDSTARYLGGAGLAVGALGLGFGVGAVLRSRRRS